MEVERQAYERKILVRNRRMRRMRQLMDEGDYFSASSLETRAPAIYHEYIGKYVRHGSGKGTEPGGGSGRRTGPSPLTGMPCAPAAGDAGGSESAAEKSNRDHGRMVNGDGERVDDNVPVCLQPGEWRENQGGQALADFLLHSIDKRDNRIRREREAADYAARESESEGDEDDGEVEMQHDGEAAGGREAREISDQELELLRTEFLRLMQERFLAGMDTAYFNYEECDDDAELDDLDAIARDAQDAYFSDDCMEEEQGVAPARSRPLNRAQAMKRFQESSRGGLDEHEYDY